ncbi:MAG: hypothetical protein IPL13_00485 [Saprospiraceae bacterium]|nr:hypothetical protein [Candidatus Brachybacter algidus]
MTWIDVIGIHDVTIIEQIGLKYKISNLLLEDILDVDQVPKYMDLDNGNFLSFQSFSYDKTSQNIIKEQISIFLQKLLLFHFRKMSMTLFNLFMKGWIMLKVASGQGCLIIWHMR